MVHYVKPHYQIRTPTVAEFKEQCLDFINEIAAADAEGRTVDVLILDGDDKVVAILTNYEAPPPPDGYGVFKGKVKILGDIVSPMPAEWFAMPDAATGESQ